MTFSPSFLGVTIKYIGRGPLAIEGTTKRRNILRATTLSGQNI